MALVSSVSFVSPPIALVIGLTVAQVVGNPFNEISYRAIKWLLKIAVIGLGFGMNIGFIINSLGDIRRSSVF